MMVLLIGTFVSILNQTLLATAIPPIMNDLDINFDTAQWLTTAFMLVNGIMIPITAFLIGTFTTRRLFIGAMMIFALGTLIAGIAPNFEYLLLGRIIQAVGAGVTMPLSQVVILNLFPVEKRGSAMGLVGLVIGLGPAIGPTLSGYLVQHFPWRSLFFVVLPIVTINIILASITMKNVTEKTNPKLDILSIVLSSFGFGGLLYGFSILGSLGITHINVIISITIGFISLIWFIQRQLRLEEPMLEFRVFKNPIFTITTILSVIVFTSMISAETLIPIYIQNVLNLSPLESGLILLPGAIVMGIMMPITGKIFDKYGVRYLAIIGMTIITVTSIFLTNLQLTTSISFVVFVYMIRMLGISMVMMPVATAGINQLSSKLISHGTAMNNAMRMVGGSIGTAVLVTIMSTFTLTGSNSDGTINGLNTAFLVSTIIAFTGLILSIFLKDTRPMKVKIELETEEM
ncbi:multidrug efflux MFS transporter [Bacillus mesophilum]|uniref:Multidrug efflux MFS transporter n=2 Tax=Bacillus mesophilum TaxID=1071718 RepID=A0A7V7RL17_9BACI|nr:MDR family MFS transporter [Bacillus mesophilum]KAB2332048.1 multidrug efflux MFS transporter [Bacillus mesophilum]